MVVHLAHNADHFWVFAALRCSNLLLLLPPLRRRLSSVLCLD